MMKKNPPIGGGWERVRDVKVIRMLEQKPMRVQAKPGQQASGVSVRLIADHEISSPGERLFEIAAGGVLASDSQNNQSNRQFFVLQGIGELGNVPGEGEVLGAGTMVSIVAGEPYSIRNIGDTPLLLIYLVEQAAGEQQAAKPEATRPEQSATKATLRPDLRKLLIYFDGGEPGGNAGAGTVSYGSYGIFVPNDKGEYKEHKADEVVRHEFNAGLTNNEAEYLALIRGLEDITRRIEALGQSPADWHIDAKGDSNLVVNQVNGNWKVKAEHLKPYIYQARELLQQFGSHTLTWHDRSNSVRVLGH
jgi:ribonuclease HI/quercetin dioxygenase-like cupin family protein